MRDLKQPGLKQTDLKQLARQIFRDTLAAIDIPRTMQRRVYCEHPGLLRCDEINIDTRQFSDFRVVAIGKAAHAMLDGLKLCLPAAISFTGIVSSPTAPLQPHPRVQYFVGGHPIPNESSWRAAQAILEMLSACDERTLVFFLLSGGGSALIELPLEPQFDLSQVQQVHRALVGCGAPIDDINAVRKHISAVKGGRLAQAAGRATKITFAVSDVPPGKESALASGPALPDPTTWEDVERVMREYSLHEKFPEEISRWMVQSAAPETPKSGDPAFHHAHFSLLLGQDGLFHPAHGAAEAAGFVTCCDNTTDDWPVERAAEYLLAQLADLRAANPSRRVAIIADGELSSPVTGNGIGGRNAAFVLACVEKIAGQSIAVLSAGTDGIDGNSPAAGAVADGETAAHAQSARLKISDAKQRSDAYRFFNHLGDAVITGPTGNNLRDLRILIAEP
jgi:glycerate 2-kinase